MGEFRLKDKKFYLPRLIFKRLNHKLIFNFFKKKRPLRLSLWYVGIASLGFITQSLWVHPIKINISLSSAILLVSDLRWMTY